MGRTMTDYDIKFYEIMNIPSIEIYICDHCHRVKDISEKEPK